MNNLVCCSAVRTHLFSAHTEHMGVSFPAIIYIYIYIYIYNTDIYDMYEHAHKSTKIKKTKYVLTTFARV